jgi:hypothetical protein
VFHDCSYSGRYRGVDEADLYGGLVVDRRGQQKRRMYAAERAFKGPRPPQVGLKEFDVESSERRWRAAVTNDRPDGLPTLPQPVHHRRADGSCSSSNENQHCNLSSPTKEI